MVRTSSSIRADVEALATREPAFARVVELHGIPEPRSSNRGAETLLRTIVGQQVSVAAARSMWAKLEAAFRERPALHRFPGNMARRTQELAAAIDRDYGGDASRIWRDASSGQDLEARLLALPGIGEMKTKTLIAIIGKRLGVKPPGWEDVAPTHPTLGDVDSPEALASFQAAKRAYKAKLKQQ